MVSEVAVALAAYGDEANSEDDYDAHDDCAVIEQVS